MRLFQQIMPCDSPSIAMQRIAHQLAQSRHWGMSFKVFGFGELRLDTDPSVQPSATSA